MSTTTLKAPAGSAGRLIQTQYGNATVAADLTVSVDSRAVASLMSAGFLVLDGEMPVGKTLEAGSHTVTSGEAVAHTCSIVTGLTSVDSYVVQILRTSVEKTQATISQSTGSITVADNGSTYVLTAGDVINWMAFGTL